MASASVARVTKADPAWLDITAANASLKSVSITVQNTGNQHLWVFFGGASAPAAGGGVKLNPDDTVVGNAANVWVYGSGYLAAFVN